MAERSKAESFTAFLEAREKQKSQTAATHPPATTEGGTPLSLLFTLAVPDPK
jgi:hypothetical protein